MKTAFIFSGQGAQAVGMGKELYENYEPCRDMFLAADEALGFSITDLCFEGGEKLNDTEYAQPAILTMSAACRAIAEASGITASYAAGLSLGEYSALYAANAIGFADVVTLVRKRGALMADAVPKGFGAMSAVCNLSAELTEKACADASIGDDYAVAANYNMPGQIVISGSASAVERAENLCMEYGAKRVIRLNVSGPFHSHYLDKAAERLNDELKNINMHPMKIPVISNVTADIIPTEHDITEILTKQIVSPVRWEETIIKLINLGVTEFIELGPGKALCTFVKKINRDVETFHIEDIRSLEATLSGR